MIFLFKSFGKKNWFHVLEKSCQSRPCFSFSEEKKQPTSQILIKKKSEDESLKIDEKLLFNLNEYKQALFYFSNEKFRISQEFFKRVLTFLENNDQKSSDNYIYILKK